MARALIAERVAQDIGVVARAGLDLETFLAEAVESVCRAVPWVAACMATQDPGTQLLTSARKFGALAGHNHHDREFGLVEYGAAEPTAFSELSRAPLPAAGVHAWHDGEIELSSRMRTFMVPRFDFIDEARVVFRDGQQVWGAMSLFRGADDRPFEDGEIDFLGSLSQQLALGVRTGLLSRLADAPPQTPTLGTAVLVIGPDNSIVSMNEGAEHRIADLIGTGDGAGDPLAAVGALVGAARRYARGESATPPRSRVRGASGMWLVLQASPLTSFADRVGEVVVTIEEARPPEIVALVVAAFDLTARERDVTQLVLQGVDTKEIAAALHVSAYTVQDHLKSVFEKADVRSRRELIARIYFDQYVPRMGSELGPTGWFSAS